MDLNVRSWQTANVFTVLEVSGEVDVYTAPQLREHLVDQVNQGHYQIIMDLEGVDYVDSPGLGVMVGGLKRTRAHDGTVRIVCTQERILKLFRKTGLVHVFPIFSSIEEAVDPVAFQLETERLVSKEAEVGGNWLNVRIFLSNSRRSRAVEKAVDDLADQFGIDVIHNFPPIKGSWFRQKLGHARRDGTLAEQLALAERALHMKALLKTQAEIDRNQADAAATLIAAVEKSKSAIVQVGSVLVVKHRETVVVRNLTQRELAFFERNPSLFRNPAAALKELQRAEADADTDVVNLQPTPVTVANGAETPHLCSCGSGLALEKCHGDSGLSSPLPADAPG